MKKIRMTLAVFFICLGLFILWKSNLFQWDVSSNSNESQPTFSKYYNGNYKDAYKKLLPAAENGDAVAQVSLGNLYYNGLGVKQSYEQAYFWYKKAADENYSYGYLNLGTMYDKGLYVKQNFSQAIELYRKAVKIDKNSTALYNLSFAYLEGKGIEQNFQKGIELLKESADQNNSKALLNLGSNYYEGAYGLPIDYKKSFNYFYKSSRIGNSMAQNNLAVLYHLGSGTEKNDFKAYKWFYIASIYGNNPKSKELINAYKFNLTDTQKQQAINEAQQWIKTHKEINLNLVGVK